MKRLILLMSLTIMLFPATLLAQEPVPDTPQRRVVRAANAARAREIDMRASELEEQARYLEMQENEIREHVENIERRERELEERAKDLEMREMEMNSPERKLELQHQKQEMAFQGEMKKLELEERRIGIEKNQKANNDDLQPLLLLVLVVNILCAVWVYQDIQKHSHESGIWIVIALITGLLGTLVYTIVRLGDTAKNKT
jgi:hypothetical protein